jgi:hypothetical protein
MVSVDVAVVVTEVGLNEQAAFNGQVEPTDRPAEPENPPIDVKLIVEVLG